MVYSEFYSIYARNKYSKTRINEMCPLEHMACYCLKYVKQLGTRVRCLLLLITSYIFLHTLCRFLSDETMTLTIVRDDPFLKILFCCPLNDFRFFFLKKKGHDSSSDMVL